MSAAVASVPTVPSTTPAAPSDTAPSAHAADLTITHAADATFTRGLRSFFEYRDLGIHAATRGGAIAHVIRAVPGTHPTGVWHRHDAGFQFVYILKGWVEFEYESATPGETVKTRLEEGSTVYQPPGIRHRETAHSDDIEILEICTPGDFGSEEVPPVA
jgi:quercetin dioxygenase-like cupin family protein